MDVKIIEQKQLVERYLFGRLSPPEAKFFEQVVRKSPELAERMGLPQALKRTMHLLDETNTEWRERAPPFWQQPWAVAGLAALALLFAALALSLWSGKSSLQSRYADLESKAAGGLLVAPTRSSTLNVAPGRGGAAPSYAIGSRSNPTMAEVRFDVSYVKTNLFKVVITRDDGTFWGRFENQVKDSNGNLRLAFNSGAFAAGSYDVSLQAVNLRGEGEPVGKLKISVAP